MRPERAARIGGPSRGFAALLALLLVNLALLGLPNAGAQAQGAGDDSPLDDRSPVRSTPTTLFFHINGFQDFPINTQPPRDGFTQDVAFGPATASVSCVRQIPATASLEFHSYYGFLSPSYVEYDVLEEGLPRIHPEREISYDVQFDAASPVAIHWFLENQAVSVDAEPNPNRVPVPVPLVTVTATMRTGGKASIDNHVFNSGALLAQGHAGPFALAGDATEAANGATRSMQAPAGSVVAHTAPSGASLYEFVVPLEYEAASIPHEEGANVRIDVFVENAACPDPRDGKLMPNTVRVHSSDGYRPRMELAIMNPLRIEDLRAEFLADRTLVVRAKANSPWGSYDVDESTSDGIALAIEGPTTPRALERVEFVQRTRGHDHHHEPVLATYEWQYVQDGARPGTYTISFKVQNDQRTAEATAIAVVRMGDCGKSRREGQEFGCAADAGGAEAAAPGIAGLATLVVMVATALQQSRAAHATRAPKKDEDRRN